MLPETFTPEFLRQIEQFRVQSRRAFLGSRQGVHISLRRGHGIEFADYRKYEQGDSIRYIDWNTYARSDRLYVKQFREEEDLNVILILDTSASMTLPEKDHKWEQARDLALALAYVSLQQQDTVTLSALGGFHSPNYRGGRSFHELANKLMELKPGTQFDYQREVRVAVSRIKVPGKAVFISDFLMPLSELETAINTLRAKNLDLTAVQVLSPSDLEPLKGMESALAIDSETGEEIEVALDDVAREDYRDLLNEHITSLKIFLQKSQIPFAQIVSDEELLPAIIGNLTSIGLLR